MTKMTERSESKSTEEKLNQLLDSPTFSTASYLNLALSSASYSEPNSQSLHYVASADDILQTKMAELALHLQVQTQACHEEIGRIGAELRAILPRCASDLGRLELGLTGMTQDASYLVSNYQSSSSLHSDNVNTNSNSNNIDKSSSIDKDTDESGSNTTTMTSLQTIETLSTLHALKTHLTHTREILHAASIYNNTLTKIPKLLSSTQTLSEAVQALSTLEAGSKALKGMPGHEQRLQQLVQIRQDILVLVSPQLLHALQKVESRMTLLQHCVNVYCVLGRVDVLVEEYVKSRAGSVHRVWFDFTYGSSNGKNTRNNHTGGNDPKRLGRETISNPMNELKFYGEDDQEFSNEMNYNNEQDQSEVTSTEDIIDPAKAFIEWLPTWYEVVLALLSEERRRALIIFGKELAPEIMAKVLHESFRPILPSFQTRLASIYSPNADENKSTDISSSGSFASICALYEATLQFLSVAYEQMIEYDSNPSSNNNINAIENNKDKSTQQQSHQTPSRTKSPVQLYSMVRSIFTSIGSPFAPYQANFAALESQYSLITNAIVSQDIHNAVKERAVTSTSLQDSTEKLGDLVPIIFPLAQAAIARFELLNGGYWAPNALSTIDSFLSTYIGELSIGIKTLSTNLFHREDYIASTFDDELVKCALEVLKVSGIVRRELNAFEGKTRDRLRVLSGRMSAAIDQDGKLRDAIEKGSQSSSLVPESLSNVELEALLSLTVCGEQYDSPVSILERFTTSDDKGRFMKLFPECYDTCTRLVKSCQSFVFDICAAIPLKHLANMSTLPSLNQDHHSSSTSPDSYGTLPQSYIIHVGEHMLALVQALEPFASDEDALTITNLVMDNLQHVYLQPWKEFATVCNLEETDKYENIIHLVQGNNFANIVVNLNAYDDDMDGNNNDDEDLDSRSAAFCNVWLDAVCSAVTGRLLERTMRIQSVSKKGCEHLAVDYNYLINVFTALGISGHPHPLLNHIMEMLTKDGEELKLIINSSNDSNKSYAKFALHNVDKRIARIRGIAL